MAPVWTGSSAMALLHLEIVQVGRSCSLDQGKRKTVQTVQWQNW